MWFIKRFINYFTGVKPKAELSTTARLLDWALDSVNNEMQSDLTQIAINDRESERRRMEAKSALARNEAVAAVLNFLDDQMQNDRIQMANKALKCCVIEAKGFLVREEAAAAALKVTVIREENKKNMVALIRQLLPLLEAEIAQEAEAAEEDDVDEENNVDEEDDVDEENEVDEEDEVVEEGPRVVTPRR